MTFFCEHPALADHVLLQTSRKNMKKLQNLKQHVQRLCKDVLTPLSKVDRDIELPSEFEEDIKIFAKYVAFKLVSLIFVACHSREMIELANNLQFRSSRSLPRRVIGADDDRDELTMLSERIKNAVDGITGSCRCTRYRDYLLITHIYSRQGKQCAPGLTWQEFWWVLHFEESIMVTHLSG